MDIYKEIDQSNRVESTFETALVGIEMSGL